MMTDKTRLNRSPLLLLAACSALAFSAFTPGEAYAAPGDTDDDGVCDDGLTIVGTCLGGPDVDIHDPMRCLDHDSDTCDDCSITGSFTPDNDGLDSDADGKCDLGDEDDDDDGVLDVNDSHPLDKNQCQDLDEDGCDDCSGGFVDQANDGADTDSDGTCDSGDIDDDNDGILDSVEGTDDIDKDGQENREDLDSDNDGIFDVVEAGHDGDDTDGQGFLACTGGYGLNGFCDALETSPDSGIADYNSDGAAGPAVLDTDGDSRPDFLDVDSDNDGIVDLIEGGSVCSVAQTFPGSCPANDADNDGIVDPFDTLNGGFGTRGYDQPINTSGAGNPDYRSLDSDGDSISDLFEGGSNCGDTDGDDKCDGDDANGDGLDDDTVASVPSFDGDAIPDYRDLDSDNDGILDSYEGSVDTDDDANPDFRDLDSDNDGIYDVVEGQSGCASAGPNCSDTDSNGDGHANDALTSTPPDTDGDGQSDYVDLDSDNDGADDVTESGGICTDTAPLDSVCDGAANGFGLKPNAGAVPPNSDNDNTPDYLDLDSDNDGLFDIIEIDTRCPDANANAVCDGGDDDNDGIVNSIDNAPGVFGDSSPQVPPNNDATGDGADYIDVDSDNDGNNDVVDSDCDDVAPADGFCDGADNDGDGAVDPVDGFDGFGVKGDRDGDGINDAIDLDDDNDGILDFVEGEGDTDGDGTIDSEDLDSDNDGILDSIEADHGGRDVNGDGVVDCAAGFGANGFCDSLETDAESGEAKENPVDTDEDDVPDFQDLDSDNDGIFDIIEGASKCADVAPANSVCDKGEDADGDGVADSIDIFAEFGAGGVPAPPNADGVDLPDYRDLDSDNDRAFDYAESSRTGDDSNNDGIVDGDADADGDGILDVVDDSDDDGVFDDEDDDTAVFGSAPAGALPDSDDDGIPDYQDNDGTIGTFGISGGGCSSSGLGNSVWLFAFLGLLALGRRRRGVSVVKGVAAAGAVLFALAGPASAQDLEQGYSIERFSLSADRNGILGVEWAAAPEGGGVNYDLALWFGFQDDPLTLYSANADGDRQRQGSLVKSRLTGSFVGSIGLSEYFQVGVTVPVVIYQDEKLGDIATGNAGDLTSLGLGDVRLLGKLGLMRQEKWGINVGVLLGLTIPTATEEAYFGEDNVSFAPALAVSRSFESGFRVAANAGYRQRKNVQVLDLEIENEVYGSLGLGYRFWDSGGPPLEVDLTYSAATAAKDFAGQFNTDYSEVKLGAVYRVIKPLSVFAAGGMGIFQGFGSPDWRALVGMRFHSLPKPKVVEKEAVDSDGDGIFDDEDQCPDQPEDMNGVEDQDGCPDGVKDADGDGIPDANDQCPEKPEDKDTFEDEDGCPDYDNDKDGVPDTDDKCMMEFGIAAMEGCPDPDRDGDGVVDRLDNCPDEPGTIDNQGCVKKQLVKINDGKIEILDVVYFRSSKAVIRPKSFTLLTNVAQVLKSHPELKTIEVEGHTDSQGKDSANLSLSQRRAESVVKFLVDKGVDKGRLSAKGYGETNPIDDNKTKKGRAANRRVEFKIVGGASGIEEQNSGPTGDTIEE